MLYTCSEHLANSNWVVRFALYWVEISFLLHDPQSCNTASSLYMFPTYFIEYHWPLEVISRRFLCELIKNLFWPYGQLCSRCQIRKVSRKCWAFWFRRLMWKKIVVVTNFLALEFFSILCFLFHVCFYICVLLLWKGKKNTYEVQWHNLVQHCTSIDDSRKRTEAWFWSEVCYCVSNIQFSTLWDIHAKTKSAPLAVCKVALGKQTFHSVVPN